MTTTIPTVAFACINPEALRVFLDLAGYTMRVVLDDTEVLEQLDPKHKDKNVVILPNFANLHLLVQHGDRIGFLLLLTNDRHEAIASMGVPILDAKIQDDGTVHRDQLRTPHWYIEQIGRSAVPLEIKAKQKVLVDPKQKAKKFKVELDTVDQWLDYIDQTIDTDCLRDFTLDIEYPVGLYLMGEASREEFKSALKVLVKRGAEKDIIKKFYKWLGPNLASRIGKAVKLYCWPKSNRPPDVNKLATKFKVSSGDIQLVDAIYSQMQKEKADEQEE